MEPKSRAFRLAAWVTEAPGQALAAFLALHALVWTVLPTLLYANLPLDLIEALMYGREWQLGYDKLPPLPWWLVEIAYRLAGHDFAYYLLAELSVCAAFALIYAAARPLLGGVGAHAAQACDRAMVAQQRRRALGDGTLLVAQAEVDHRRYRPRGRPSTRSPTMLRWISEVPPAIVCLRSMR